MDYRFKDWGDILDRLICMYKMEDDDSINNVFKIAKNGIFFELNVRKNNSSFKINNPLINEELVMRNQKFIYKHQYAIIKKLKAIA